MLMPFYDYSDRLVSTSIEEYTITQHWGELERKSINEMIEFAKQAIFDFDFPFYSNNSEDKNSFETMFILNNYNRMIAYETIGQFKLRLLAILTRRMPYYTKLYETTLIKWNPLENRNYTILKNYKKDEKDNITENVKVNDSGNTSNTTSNTDNNQDINSNNPQINFAGTDYASTMTRGQRKSDGTNNTNITSNSNSNRTGNTTRTGNNSENSVITGLDSGNPAELISGYRDMIVNINELLCNDLEELFSCFY